MAGGAATVTSRPPRAAAVRDDEQALARSTEIGRLEERLSGREAGEAVRHAR